MQPKVKYFNEGGIFIDVKYVPSLLAKGEKIGIQIIVPPMTFDEYEQMDGFSINSPIWKDDIN